MNKQLQMAVNHAINDARLARARMGLLNPSMGLDAKRNSAWCEYGFKEELTFGDLYNLYRRGGIAHGAINKIISACWHTSPEIIEGEEEDETRDITAWERSLLPVFTHRFWRSFADADLRRLVGRYSAILLHIRDGKAWNQQATKGRGLEKITVAWAGSVKVKEWDTGLNSRAYGQPKMWQYTERLPNGSTRRVDIHPDRIFILGDYADDAIGFLEPAYNAFVSLEKVEGGSGESFLKNAARQLSINFDKEAKLDEIARAYGVDYSELNEIYDKVAREMNIGNDSVLITQGANVAPIVAAVSDPSPTYNVNLQTAAAALDIPTKILVGMQTGERASTEDQKYFNTRCQSRREDLSFDIEDLCDKLIELGVIDAVAKKTGIWDDLNEQSSSEKLDAAQKMSQINSASLATGEQVFTGEEIRVAAGYEGSPEPLPEVDDDEEEESEVTDTTRKP